MTKSAREVFEAAVYQYVQTYARSSDVAKELLSALSAAGYVIVPKELLKRIVEDAEREAKYSDDRWAGMQADWPDLYELSMLLQAEREG